jgi:hypothetical protein
MSIAVVSEMLQIIRPGDRQQEEVDSGHPAAFAREPSKSTHVLPHYNHFPSSSGRFVGLACALAVTFPPVLAMIYWPSTTVGDNLATIILG